MTQIPNSDVVKEIIQKLISISSRKTTQGSALSNMNSLLKQLETKYSFLKNIQIKDIQYSEDPNPVSVMGEINTIQSIEIGRAIQALIRLTNKSLGKNAGYFFIKEIQKSLNDEYTFTMQSMGVDLGLMQLENEVERFEKQLTTKKKD